MRSSALVRARLQRRFLFYPQTPPPPARPGADPSAVDEDGGDALWWATEQGHAAVVARLQGAGDMMGETPRCVCHPRHQRSSAKLFWFE